MCAKWQFLQRGPWTSAVSKTLGEARGRGIYLAQQIRMWVLLPGKGAHKKATTLLEDADEGPTTSLPPFRVNWALQFSICLRALKKL